MNECHKMVLYNKRKIPIELVRLINKFVPSKNCYICNRYGICYTSIYLCSNTCRMIFIVKMTQGITSASIFFTVSLIGESISSIAILCIVISSIGMRIIHYIVSILFYLLFMMKVMVILLCKE